MEPKLLDILRKASTEYVAETHTHETFFGPCCRWNIKSHMYNCFWKEYCELLEAKKEEYQKNKDNFAVYNMCLAEKPQEIMPLIAKFTFKFHNDPSEDTWEPYDDNFLYHLCYTYQKILSDHFRTTNESDIELIVIVLESRSHWYEEDRENGQKNIVIELKLQFPYARIESGLQNRIIRKNVIQMLRNNNIFSKMQRQPIGDWEQIISSVSINEPIVMYGSSEVQGRPTLELMHIWPKITAEMLENGDQPNEIPLDDAFVPQNHIHVLQQIVSQEMFQEKPLEHWIPLFLSIGHWPTVLFQKPEINAKSCSNGTTASSGSMMSGSQRVFGMGSKNRYEDEDDEMELAERMIQMLKPERFFKETFWHDIGKALYNADNGGDNGLLSWTRHTEKNIQGLADVPVFMKITDNIAETCKNLYHTFSGSPITVKSLAWYARDDNPERYANWHRDWCMSSMEQALSGNHTDVASSLYRVYWLDFLYSSTGKGKWFMFKNHKWEETAQALELRKKISKDFVKRFEQARMILCRQLHDSSDEAFKSNGELTLKKITALIGKLKTVPFKSCIVTESCEFFNNGRFMSLLDSNSDLTGLSNGVLEVNGSNVTYRHAKPEDYISMSTNIPYHSNYSWEHPLVSECMTWIGQVFTDKALQHHFLKFAASGLKGKNSDKIFPIWTGEGDNSKSMIVKLFEAAYGAYCIKFPVSMLSEKAMNSSGPTPQLARAKSTRFAFLDEPEDDVPLQKGTIKRYTGGDSFFARLLQDNGGDIKATFKMILMCNKVPIIPNADVAVKNRTKLFPFTSTWVDEPPSDLQEQYNLRMFKKNPLFERRIPLLAPAFLWIMASYHPYYDNEKLPQPSVVTEYTEKYWRDNDVYAQFTADCIQEVYDTNGKRDNASRLSLSEIYSEFKIWFRDAFPGTKIPERAMVRSELSSRWGRMNGTAWHGIRLMNNDNSVDMVSVLAGKKNKQQNPTIIAEPATINDNKNVNVDGNVPI